MAEWLRRQTWNLVGFARVGSNPAADEYLLLLLLFFIFYFILIMGCLIKAGRCALGHGPKRLQNKNIL